jgi:N-acyl-phosphatidylethanolamine-hydrolysing phospholipase D
VTFAKHIITIMFLSTLSAHCGPAKASDDAEAVTLSAASMQGAPRQGDIYTNPSKSLSHGNLGVRISFMLRRFGTYFRDGNKAPEQQTPDTAQLRSYGKDSQPTVTWIGHSTLLLQMGGLTFLTDPIWSKIPSPIPPLGPRRFVPPAVAISELPTIDFIMISHNHYDHLDLPTLRMLAARYPQTLFLVPLGNATLLHRHGIDNVKELDWGESIRLAGLTVHCLPAQHWSKRSLTDTNKALWSSWAVVGEHRRFYHAGDTGYFPGFKKIAEHLGPFDLAAVPIGAYAPRQMMRASHMNPEEAITAALDLEAKTAVAMHFGTFDLSDEPLDQPPRRFKEAAASQGLGEQQAWVLKIGETRSF